MKDIVVLVADLDTENAIRGLFTRPDALGTRPFSFDIFRHEQRDPGCLRGAVDFLRSFTKRYQHALVIFDYEGCGRNSEEPAKLQSELTNHLANSGWAQRAATIIIDPELEIWVWSDSPHVDDVLGWKGRSPSLRQWLSDKGWLPPNTFKPARPKEAMHAALRVVKKIPSAAAFLQLGRSVSFQRCVDPAFQTLLGLLRKWFPLQEDIG